MAPQLNEEQIHLELMKVPGWRVENHLLCREFEFAHYRDGLEFAMRVGQAADLLDHHPDIHIGYKKVAISVSTHSAGGLTLLDFELAAKVTAL